MEPHAAFSPTAALKFGWDQALAHLKILLPIGAIGAFLALVQNLIDRTQGAPGLRGIFDLAIQVAQVGVTLAFLKTALRLHDDQPIDKIDPGGLLAGFWSFLFTNLVYGLIVAAGFVLLIVPGVLWALRYGLAPFVAAERRCDPAEALRESRRLTEGRRWLLFKLGLLLFVVNLAGAMALGIGLFVTVPTSWIAAAYAFRRLQAESPERTARVEPPARPIVPISPEPSFR